MKRGKILKEETDLCKDPSFQRGNQYLSYVNIRQPTESLVAAL